MGGDGELWRALQLAGAEALDVRSAALAAHVSDYGGDSPAIDARGLTTETQRLTECAAHVAMTGDPQTWEGVSMGCAFRELRALHHLDIWGTLSLATEHHDPLAQVRAMVGWARGGVNGIRRDRRGSVESDPVPTVNLERRLRDLFDVPSSMNPHPLAADLRAVYDAAALRAALGDHAARRVADHVRQLIEELRPRGEGELFAAWRVGLRRRNVGWRAAEGAALLEVVRRHARPATGAEELAGRAFLVAATRVGWAEELHHVRALARREEALAGHPDAEDDLTWPADAEAAESAHVVALKACWWREQGPRRGRKGDPARRAATVALEALGHDPRPFFNAIDKRASDRTPAAKKRRTQRRAARNT